MSFVILHVKLDKWDNRAQEIRTSTSNCFWPFTPDKGRNVGTKIPKHFHQNPLKYNKKSVLEWFKVKFNFKKLRKKSYLHNPVS
jgi:hypothetical protein